MRREVLNTYEEFKKGVLACDDKSVRTMLRSAIPELTAHGNTEQDGPTILNFKIKRK